jgi:hypothetical protein
MESSYKPCISNIEEVASIGVIRSCVSVIPVAMHAKVPVHKKT